MKKLCAAVLVTGLAFSGISAGNVEAASGNSIQSVNELQHGDQSLEGAKLGSSIQSVLKNNKNQFIHINLMAQNIIMNLKR